MPAKPDSKGEGAGLPEDFDSLRARIRARYVSLPKRLAAIARYILDSPDDVALNSATDIAAAAHVTPSTLIRFAQLFGYDGFAAIQTMSRDALRDKVSRGVGRTDQKISERNEGPDTRIFRQTLDAFHRALDGLSSSITIRNVQIAVRIINCANCVFVIGRGSTYPVMVGIGHVLMRSKIKTILLTDIAGGEEQLACAARGDAAIVFACGSDADQMAGSTSKLIRRGIPVIAMTDTELSPLSELASVCFTVTGAGVMQKSIAAIALGEVLASGVSLLREEQARTT
ncbi:MurR/RpiR family transcriptional regulator [Rhizobium sp. RM]|uniref:MurR/RpiR family transcriptional regulator n=1 Tax=Rhizobium sp. RM TaxID=2748079 RepID=UPI00110ECA3E|nr:MurR/RpiR family transcriptional regulator [Rhizobium sp. RM]NWJ25288.1 MurR/RpiR family transcriptional regulator [Rhizobium sp. RM]TMV17621.1 MurR/RpiR family transcriptional regulator [Rhizobium sp. Td3]